MSMLRNSIPRPSSSSSLDMMSSPVTIPIRSLPAKPEFASNFAHGIGTTFDVYASGICGDANISFDARRQYLLHQGNEILRITGVRISRALFLHDRHRHFREIVEHQVVDRPTFNLAHGCIRQIAPETLTGSNANLLFHLELMSEPDSFSIFHFSFQVISDLISCPFAYFVDRLLASDETIHEITRTDTNNKSTMPNEKSKMNPVYRSPLDNQCFTQHPAATQTVRCADRCSSDSCATRAPAHRAWIPA